MCVSIVELLTTCPNIHITRLSSFCVSLIILNCDATGTGTCPSQSIKQLLCVASWLMPRERKTRGGELTAPRAVSSTSHCVKEESSKKLSDFLVWCFTCGYTPLKNIIKVVDGEKILSMLEIFEPIRKLTYECNRSIRWAYNLILPWWTPMPQVKFWSNFFHSFYRMHCSEPSRFTFFYKYILIFIILNLFSVI